MPLPVIADAYQCRLQYLVQTQICMNVFTVIDDSGVSTPEIIASEVASTFATDVECWWDVMSDQIGPDFTLGVTPFDGVSNEIFANGTFPTGATGSELPGQNAIVVKYSAATGGRSGRGRMFIPGMMFNMTHAANSNRLADAFIAIMDTDFGDWRDALANEQLTLGVFSRTDGVVRPVTSHSINPYVASQRRRGQQ